MRYQKQNRLCLAALFGCWAAFIASCGMAGVGMGPVVDLEPPSLEAISIGLESGTSINLREAVSLGKQLYVSPKSVLHGEAFDNVGVTRIVAEEIGVSGETLNRWDKASIGSRNGSGKQQWSIVLEGIEEGERTIRITAYDSAGNTGINSVKQLTVLVDKDGPFIKDIYIERAPGIMAQLLGVDTLQAYDENKYQNIDYFQNESFKIRASVDTLFSLTSVALNLNDQANRLITTIKFDQTTSGVSLYAPVWEITHDMLVGLNPAYTSGKHYFRVTITANAASGLEENTDQFLYLCWYPEADIPHIVVLSDKDAQGFFPVNKDSDLPVETFDDDNLDEAYIRIFTPADWNNLPGANDQEKIDKLIVLSKSNKETTFPNPTSATTGPSKHWSAASPQRYTILSVSTGSTSGDFRLAVLAKDVGGKWIGSAEKLTVTDNEIPTIRINSPDENTAPALTNGKKFSITGNILDNKASLVMRAAWIPDGMSGSTAEKITAAENLLKPRNQTDGTTANGIRIWSITPQFAGTEIIGGKVFQNFAFTHEFNIETDFIYNGATENKNKLFVLYVRDLDGNEAFREFRLLSYITGPVITVASPANGEAYGSGAPIPFSFTVRSAQGLGIAAVSLVNTADRAHPISLTPPPFVPGGRTVYRVLNPHQRRAV